MRFLQAVPLAFIGLSLHSLARPAEPVPVEKGSGLTADPAVSSDGRQLAFASDRDGSGFLHLWVRPVGGGAARQLTRGSHDEREPAFSPDGKMLAYRSEANGGGIFTIAVGSGRARLLVKDGRHPRFSPDGKFIVYSAVSKPGLFVIDIASRSPRPVQPEFSSASDAAWSPDGKSLIFSGCKNAAAESCDWWVSPVEGGKAAPVGAAQAFRPLHITPQPSPDLWLGQGNAIVFSAKTGEKTRLWTLKLKAGSWQVDGAPRRVSTSDADERTPAAGPDGTIFFASRAENIDVWSQPLDADHAKAKGKLVRLTTDPSIDQRPTLSTDGKKIAWETSRGGNFEVWVKDLASGQEKAITSGPLREHMPAISRDGGKLLFDAHDGDKVTVFESSFDGGAQRKVWEENVGQGSFQWTAKGDAVLYFHRAPPGTVGLMDLTTKKRTVLLRHPKWNLSLADARLSPDGQWIALPVPFAPHRSRLAVAKITSKVIEDENDWTYLTPESFNASQPEWSPNGQWLYFLSDQSGKLGVWALALSADKKASAAPKSIVDFPQARLNITEMRPRDIGVAVAIDKLALGVTEYSGSLLSVKP